MKCANHYSNDAIGLCISCNKALCPECQASDGALLCAPCLVSHNRSVMRQFYLQLALSGVLGLLAFFFTQQYELGAWDTTKACLMAAFFPFGWAALSRYFSPGGEYFNFWVRLASLLAHAAIAALLGWLVGPIQIYKAVKEISKAHAANASVKG